MGLNFEYLPVDQLTPYENNARKHQQEDVEAIAASIREFGFDDPIGVWGKKNVIVEGHGRLLAAKRLGLAQVPVIHLDHLTDEQRRAYALAHNRTAELSTWDDVLRDLEVAGVTELDMRPFGFFIPGEELPPSWFDRDEKEGNARQAGNDEYNEFLDKFEPKKTTDDCYTPDNIYEAVAGWVANRYKVNRRCFIRPFFPGGDYRHEKYPEGCVVVDNPPFSILKEIVVFYSERKTPFFLFAPSLTVFNYIAHGVTAVAEYSSITYENGADVKTSFLTNMEPGDVAAFTDCTLYNSIDEANEKNKAIQRRNLPRYEYPDEVLTAAKMGWLCQYGQELIIPRNESMPIRALDAQTEQDKAIFGCGLLLSERAAAERAAAERAAAERAAAMKWVLSERERALVKSLGVKTES